MSRHPLRAIVDLFRCGEPAFRPQLNPEQPRILVIRRNRMGDMICTLPLLQALRRHYPQAHLAVACDAAGQPIAEACASVNETILLESGGLRPLTLRRNVRKLRRFDWVIAAKGGYDKRLAKLTKLTRGALRIGFASKTGGRTAEYTDAVAPPTDRNEHQVETLLRLMMPLGVTKIAPLAAQMSLEIPEASREFARAILSRPELKKLRGVVLINISSTSRLRFRKEDFLNLTARLLSAGEWAVGFVSAPADHAEAQALAERAASPRVVAIATPGPLDLAALLEHAVLFITPEGGAAHLAAATGTPAVVLWSEGPFEKWRSRGERHVFVQTQRREKHIPVERVWPPVDDLLKSLVQ